MHFTLLYKIEKVNPGIEKRTRLSREREGLAWRGPGPLWTRCRRKGRQVPAGESAHLYPFMSLLTVAAWLSRRRIVSVNNMDSLDDSSHEIIARTKRLKPLTVVSAGWSRCLLCWGPCLPWWRNPCLAWLNCVYWLLCMYVYIPRWEGSRR